MREWASTDPDGADPGTDWWCDLLVTQSPFHKTTDLADNDRKGNLAQSPSFFNQFSKIFLAMNTNLGFFFFFPHRWCTTTSWTSFFTKNVKAQTCHSQCTDSGKIIIYKHSLPSSLVKGQNQKYQHSNAPVIQPSQWRACMNVEPMKTFDLVNELIKHNWTLHHIK